MHTRIGAPSYDLGGDCEECRLIRLRGEYESFILDLESEVAFLNHIIVCENCRGRMNKQLEAGTIRDKYISNLLDEDLPSILGEASFTEGSGGCPKREDYVDTADFIVGRIQWRIKRLKEIRADAENELRDITTRLEKNLNEKQETS